MFLTINSLRALEVISQDDYICIVYADYAPLFQGYVHELECNPDRNLGSLHVKHLGGKSDSLLIVTETENPAPKKKSPNLFEL